MQRQATERAEADKAWAEHETAQALAMAAVNRRRSRAAILGGLAALAFGVVAVVFGFQAQRAKHNAEALTLTAQAGELWDCPECRPMEEIARDVARKVGRELTAAERLRFGLPSAPSPVR